MNNYSKGKKRTFLINEKPKKEPAYIGVIAIGPNANNYPYFFFYANKHIKDLNEKEVDSILQQSCNLYPGLKKLIKHKKSIAQNKNEVGIFEIIQKK